MNLLSRSKTTWVEAEAFCWAVQNGVPAHYDYAPFGAITRTAKNTPFTLDLISLNPWRFSSEFYDSELDLIYYNYRHYSPSLGRWLSRDPIEEQDGLNLYAFVENNTVSSYDRLGETSCNCPPGEDEGRFEECLSNCLRNSNTQWALGLLGLSLPTMSVPLKPSAPFGSTPTWTTLLSYIEFETGLKFGLRRIGRRLNPIANAAAVFAASFLVGTLLGCLGVCAADDFAY